MVIGPHDDRRAAQFREVLPKALQTNAFGFVLEGRVPWLARGRSARLLPWIRARRRARALLAREIERRRRTATGGDDVLSVLMAASDEAGRRLSDAALEDQLLTLLLAGHETTASTLAFCFERLSRHPAVLDRLTSEVRAGAGDRYLEAVIDETQRQRPVVEVAWRKLARPIELGGYVLPAGTIVLPTIRGVHASAFDDPDEFRPERFLEHRPAPYSLIPFGGGTRRCLGASFARLEMKVVLRSVLERCELQVTDSRAERCKRTQRITTIPARGGRITVRARRSA